MNYQPQPTELEEEWPEPAPRFLRETLPPPPMLPLEEVFTAKWAHWIGAAAEAKSAPPDYVMGGLLATVGAAIGNSRWVSPWAGWSEPPIIWTMLIGAPSSNKSPALDAVLTPLKAVEREARQDKERDLRAWADADEVAKLAEAAWKERAKAALKQGKKAPPKPTEAHLGPEPHLPCLVVTDSTVERLGVILANQTRGTLMARDELSGWLLGMTRYAGGGSDRPFWLEAYGGRSYRVERIGRDPAYVERLSVGVTGSIQPDRLRSLLIKSDDDGLLARFLPIWPDAASLKRPAVGPDEPFIEHALRLLHGLRLATDDQGQQRPWLLPFTEEACQLLDAFRIAVRSWEDGADGLVLSFIGKLPGLAARLALILVHLDWLSGESDEPHEISAHHFRRASCLVEAYALPMARRAYGDASLPQDDRAALRLVETLREKRWSRFTSRDVLRLDRAGLGTARELNPVLSTLEANWIIRAVEERSGSQGGRPSRVYKVNPVLHRDQK
ncbi:YfjI family protein [Thalassobaculum salexigens]|uniref:YfjI family protein n=1 Tax=Thalassobaculum salexigens TaxID=455360 RepID=UPI000419A81F|nr:YfjI family protein [Thalassobaculum salexigens]